MGRASFWSWPPGWRAAFPWGVLLGVLVVGGLVAGEGVRGGRAALDRVFWVEVAVLFPLVVLGGTAVLAARPTRPDRGGGTR